MTTIVLLSLVVVVTVAAVGGWVIQIVRRHRGVVVSPSVVTMLTVIAVVGWCWTVAFDAAFGDVRWLRGPVILVSAILAFGAIYSLTGLRPRRNVVGERTGSFVGREGAVHVNEWDDPRFR